MILVDNQLNDLVAGYERILQAEVELLRRWRGPLLAAYARRRAAYESELAEHNRVMPDPPLHPFKSSLVGPLLPLWLEGIRGQLPAEKAYEGAPGEYHFIARLQILDPSSFVIYRLQQQPGDDIDVTIVGPRGVWVFEVKYLKGTIRWRDGVWTQRKTYHRRSGLPVTEIKDTGEAYDQQWRRMADSIEETIRRRALETVERVPKVTRVRGGIVFTHPQGKYDIPPGCPFNWGVIPFWLEKLHSVPEVP